MNSDLKERRHVGFSHSWKEIIGFFVNQLNYLRKLLFGAETFPSFSHWIIGFLRFSLKLVFPLFSGFLSKYRILKVLITHMPIYKRCYLSQKYTKRAHAQYQFFVFFVFIYFFQKLPYFTIANCFT